MADLPLYQNYVDGRFLPAAEDFLVHNPATGEALARVPASSRDHVDQAIAAARRAQKAWARKPAIERAGHLRRIAAKLRELPAGSRVLGFNYDTGERYLSVPDFLPE